MNMNKKFLFTPISIIALIVWNFLLVFPFKYSEALLLPLGIYLCLILPGLLITIILGSRRLSLQAAIYSVGISIITLYLLSLIANFLPALLGVHNPLNTPYIVPLVDLTLILLILFSFKTNREVVGLHVPLRINRADSVVALVNIIALTMCVLGTFRLNNGGSNIVSLIGFLVLVSSVVLTYCLRKKVSTFTYAFVLMTLCAGIMLTTSLRGWFINGQDLREEYQIYQITVRSGYWSMSNIRNSYNACLSITLFPYALSKLLHISDNLIFKATYQTIFCIFPLAIFTILRSKFSKIISFLGSVAMLSLPTFSIDMPLMGRQEMAFLLLALALSVWFCHSEPWVRKNWKVLFIFFSIGTILSHYSTSYIYVATLISYYLIYKVLGAFNRNIPANNDSSINGVMVSVIALIAFFWLGQVTSVAGDLAQKVGNSIETLAVDNGQFSNSGSIVPFLKTNTADPLSSYLSSTSIDKNNDNSNSVNLITDKQNPSTLTRWLPSFVTSFGQEFSSSFYYTVGTRLYQLFILIGVIVMYAQFRSSKKYGDIRYTLFAIATILLLFLQILLPDITQDYGIPRAFIQAFIVLCIPFLVGIIYFLKFFKFKSKLINHILLGFVVLMLLNYSGIISEIFGGLRPELNFNNAGPYYGTYYTHKSEILAYGWIDKNIPSGGNVNAPDWSYTTAEAYYPGYSHYGGGILPFQLNNTHYVLLNYPQTNDQGLLYISGSLLPVRIDMQTYSSRLNLLYTNGQSDILHQ
jgi:uncharacterized membrane protein